MYDPRWSRGHINTLVWKLQATSKVLVFPLELKSHLNDNCGSAVVNRKCESRVGDALSLLQETYCRGMHVNICLELP